MTDKEWDCCFDIIAADGYKARRRLDGYCNACNQRNKRSKTMTDKGNHPSFPINTKKKRLLS